LETIVTVQIAPSVASLTQQKGRQPNPQEVTWLIQQGIPLLVIEQMIMRGEGDDAMRDALVQVKEWVRNVASRIQDVHDKLAEDCIPR
jgi:hypothetical protein